MSTLFDLSDQVAFITGAAKGLGFAMAEVAAEHGAVVVMADNDMPNLARASESLSARKLRVHTRQLDVTDLDALKRSIDASAKEFGRLDILFANAGLSAGPGPLSDVGGMDDVDLTQWNAVLHANLTSTFVAIRTAANHMRPRKQGRIVVTASIAGIRAEPMCGYAYAATKAGIINLVRQFVIELSPDNIMINAIAPGPFKTHFGSGRMQRDDVAVEFSETVPLGRIGTPNEIKGAALLLASPAASFMTGAIIAVDGGATSH
ncbi:gluconate 5-dehydrogenase [Tardiphaga sp. OK246]|uniref:SDR family NAD(P)-dependent oxidoreductase n=1 Tax=Tardiphaga sp. OK246 TaxID=1855307 RepID=UPI000B6CBE75|nr:SDR family NAD(P)-dependent oxidoreductase [Tardiphaga sp. OK246]SNT31905.1 gluconate 5-dehydrogenase [Tardiphaga sp. OK246]